MDFLFWYILVSIFILGVIIGSFLNCVIWRSYANESAARGRSYCPKCRHQLKSSDLVPLFSFLALGGRCRYCKEKISIQYPLVEAATGVFFVAAALVFAPAIFSGDFDFIKCSQLLSYWLILSSLMVIFVADLRWYFIPDGAVISGLAGAVILRFLQFNETASLLGQSVSAAESIFNPLLSAIFAASFFLALFLVSRGTWMGFGDVKYAFLMGLTLGFPDILVGLFLAFFFGAILGLGLVAGKRKKMSSQIPFGPFLVAGTLAALFFSPAIINWYLPFSY